MVSAPVGRMSERRVADRRISIPGCVWERGAVVKPRLFACMSVYSSVCSGWVGGAGWSGDPLPLRLPLTLHPRTPAIHSSNSSCVGRRRRRIASPFVAKNRGKHWPWIRSNFLVIITSRTPFGSIWSSRPVTLRRLSS